VSRAPGRADAVLLVLRSQLLGVSTGARSRIATTGYPASSIASMNPCARGPRPRTVEREGRCVLCERQRLQGGDGTTPPRAIFLSVLVSEVHPFLDGNGRIARVMMNAELVSAEERRILIPIGYREDYLLALRAFSRQRRTEPAIRMLARAQQFTAEIDFSDWNRVRRDLERCGAFDDPEQARLLLPAERDMRTRDP